MIKLYTSYDSIWHSKAGIYVNPVNCVGISGKGLALEFKKRFPLAFEGYKKYCDNGKMRHFKIKVSSSGVEFPGKPHTIIHVATKEHWKNPSNLDFVKDSICRLRNLIYKESYLSIAIPALGCGLGGLVWRDVRAILIEEFSEYFGTLELYPPYVSNKE